MSKKKKLSSRQERILGMDMKITRRDFLNASLIGAGALLFDFPSPGDVFAQESDWDGPGGSGDYATAHGNMEKVRRAAHKMRDGAYNTPPPDAIDTGETYDLVIIGGGLSGLGAAHECKKISRGRHSCLVLENHDIFGGEARRNEFDVNGQKLTAPQGSNAFAVLNRRGSAGYDIYNDLDIPTRFRYQKIPRNLKSMQFDRTNYGFMLWFDAPSIGHHFDEQSHKVKPQWVRELWDRNLDNSPFSAKMKQDMNTWRTSTKSYYLRGDIEQWLDTITYKDYIENIMGLSSGVTDYADPILAVSVGLGCDVISAYAAYQIGMPGFKNYLGWKQLKDSDWHAFPGGNDGMARHLVKKLIPGSIHGKDSFEDIMNNSVNFGELDKTGRKMNIRLGSLAVRVEHNARPDNSDFVWVTYVKDDKVYRLKAKSVVVSSGGWVARNIIRDLPAELMDAYQKFYRSPMLIANVALTNWRFLHKLGLSACRWFNGFGFSCNIRQPMNVGSYQQPLDPDKPIVLTFYVPFYFPGTPIQQQGSTGRTLLLYTEYYDYERQIREQLVRLFGSAGFDPKKDIAGIILNRWGHAYVTPQPGFYFGRNGKPAPRDVVKKGYGRVSFGNAEHNGHQNWVSAVEEGARAARQALGTI